MITMYGLVNPVCSECGVMLHIQKYERPNAGIYLHPVIYLHPDLNCKLSQKTFRVEYPTLQAEEIVNAR